MTWTTYINLFSEWLRAGARAESTINSRRRWVQHLARAQPDSDPLTITGEEILAWLSWPDWAPATRKSAQVSIRRFFTFMTTNGYRADDPTTALLSIRIPKYTARPTPDAVLDAALSRCTTTEEELILILAAYAGLRRTEIATLHTNDIMAGWFSITGKGGHTRLVPIHPVLDPYLRLKTTGYLFPGRFSNHRHPDWVGRRISKLLGPGYTSHQLRHWFATTGYRETGDLRAIQELLGHASIATTQTYVGLDHDALTTAVNAIPSTRPTSLPPVQ